MTIKAQLLETLNRYGLQDAGEITSGHIWFVDSTAAQASDANDGEHGKSWDAPLATLGYGFSSELFGAGDVVYVAQGHAEDYGDGEGFDASVAGVRVVGLGDVHTRPTFTYDHADAQCTVSANNVRLRNLRFVPSVTAVKVALEISEDVTGTVLESLLFDYGEDGAGVDEFIKGIYLEDGNHDTTLRDVQILTHASAAQSTHGIHIDAASDRLTLERVVIHGNWATNGILEDAAGTHHSMTDCSFLVDGTELAFNVGSTFVRRWGNFVAGSTEDANIEVTTGLATNNLDHLVKVAVADTSDHVDMVEVVDDTILANILTDDGDTSEYDRRTDSLEAISDKIGVADGATTDSLNGKIGTDTEMADNSLYDLMGAAAKVTPLSDGGSVLVKKTGIALTDDDVEDVFTVAGGPVIIEAILLEITSAVSADACNMSWQADPTSGSDTDMTGVVDISAATQGTFFAPGGDSADAMVEYVTGTALPILSVSGNTNMVVPAGGIDLILSNSAPSTGVATAYVRYRPLAVGATVTPAA
jgi:hypothetical protein